jgi:hypothetical protein
MTRRTQVFLTISMSVLFAYGAVVCWHFFSALYESLAHPNSPAGPIHASVALSHDAVPVMLIALAFFLLFLFDLVLHSDGKTRH